MNEVLNSNVMSAFVEQREAISHIAPREKEMCMTYGVAYKVGKGIIFKVEKENCAYLSI